MKKIFTVILTLLMFGISHSQELINVSVDPQKDSDSVIIELSGAVEPNVFTLKEPDRLVIDLKDAFWDGSKKIIETSGDRISNIRWAQNSVRPNNVRVVIDLKQKVRHEIISEDEGKKLVLRLFGGALPDAAPEKKVSPEALSVLEKVTQEAGGRRSVELPLIPAPAAEDTAELPTPAPGKKEIVPSSRIKMPRFSKIKNFSVYINKKKLDLGRKPIFIKDTLMAPAGDLFSSCGFDVSFDKRTKILTARNGTEEEVTLSVGSNMIDVNGTERAMPVPAQKISGRLYVPLISTVKWIGLGATWEKETKSVFIGPRITKISWEEIAGTKSVVIAPTRDIPTFETEEKGKPLVFVLTVPNIILDLDKGKIPVNEEGIRGIKAFQAGGNARIGIYLEEKQVCRLRREDSRLIVNFPPAVTSVSFTEEAGSVRIDIISTKPVLFETKRLSDPERIIIDIPGAVYSGPNHLEIGKGDVLRMRASQFKTDPLTSRVVIDLSSERPFGTGLSDDSRFFSLGIEKSEVAEEKPVKKVKKVSVLKNKVVVIDPGHGGSDPGAFGESGDSIREKDLDLATAVKLARMLSEAGAIPLLTREEDHDLNLQSRVEFVKNNKADILVCMHYNSSFKSDISGTETYYYNPNSKLLASLVHRSMLSGLGRQDRGLSQVKFFVIYNSPVPSVLVEPVYLSDRNEERLATDSEFQEKVARSVFDGIKQYFEVLKKIG